MNYTVTVEYDLSGIKITQTLENLEADSVQDAEDAAYERIKRNESSSKNIEILIVTKEG